MSLLHGESSTRAGDHDRGSLAQRSHSGRPTCAIIEVRLRAQAAPTSGTSRQENRDFDCQGTSAVEVIPKLRRSSSTASSCGGEFETAGCPPPARSHTANCRRWISRGFHRPQLRVSRSPLLTDFNRHYVVHVVLRNNLLLSRAER